MPGDAAITAAVVGDESVTLRWTTAVDLSAVTRYTILQNLVEVGTVAAPTTEFQVSDLMADTEYVFDVYAYDRVGNRSVNAQRLVIRTSDSQVPSWSVDALVNVSQIEETTAQVRWSQAADNVGVVGYRVDVDGQTVYLGDGYRRYADLTSLQPLTNHRVEIFARDRAGGWSVPLGTTLTTLDVTPPSWAAGASLEFDARSETEIEVRWTLANDVVGVDAYLVTVNGNAPIRLDSPQGSLRVSNLAAWTSYVVRIDAEDASGNPDGAGTGGYY